MGFGAVAAALGSSALSMAEREVGAEQAYKKMRRSRKSVYQDTMADMKAAGLNPILAGTVGGNSAQTIDSNSFDSGQKGINTALAKSAMKLNFTQAQRNTYESGKIQADTIYQDMMNSVTAAGLHAEIEKMGLSTKYPVLKQLQLIMESIGLKSGTISKGK